MGLYLCVFDGDEELDGVEVGAYSDFADFRNTVANLLEGNKWGSRFPTLMMHPDNDGVWSAQDSAKLESELETISNELKQHPAKEFFGWQKNVAEEFDLKPASLYDCFIDVNGDPLVERLIDLTKLSQHRELPIVFQ